jgi:hypothetical protein
MRSAVTFQASKQLGRSSEIDTIISMDDHYCFDPNDSGEGQKSLAIFSGLILKKIINVKKLIINLVKSISTP